MNAFYRILMQMFGRPQGGLGTLGGMIMARTNKKCAAWVISQLEVQPNDRVLEVGFGPGVGIELLSELAAAGYVAGVDPSKEMFDQAAARNGKAIASGRVDLRQGFAESLPFDDSHFDETMAINSMQVWPDAVAGLREIRRVTKTGGRVALGFTPYSGQRRGELTETLSAAGFTEVRMVETDGGFCALAVKLGA